VNPPFRLPAPGLTLAAAFGALLVVGCAAESDVPDRGYNRDDKTDAAGGAVDYATYYEQTVLPYCLGHGTEGSFTGVNGLTIRTMSFERASERAAVVILPGRSEPVLKYCELVYDLRTLPVSIHLIDHRGQGFSDRMLPDSQKGYVDEFSDYTDDVETFVTQLKAAHAGRRIFMLAHSMGGAMATLLAERSPDLIEAMVLSSPMEEVNTDPYWESVALGYATSLVVIGKGAEYAPGKGPYDPNEAFEGNTVTHSRERFAMTKQVVAEHPELAIGGPTARWVKEAIEGTISARTFAWQLKTPTLLLQAGDDKIVKLGGQDWVCARASDCSKITLAGGSHELLMEKDPIRDRALDEILGFFAKHL
jgi:lysophospholipase